MRQLGEVLAVNRSQGVQHKDFQNRLTSNSTKRFATVNDPSIMNNEAEKNDNRTEPVATSAAKQPWHAPEIEEVDFSDTQSGGAPGGNSDGNAYS